MFTQDQTCLCVHNVILMETRQLNIFILSIYDTQKRDKVVQKLILTLDLCVRACERERFSSPEPMTSALAAQLRRQ